MADKMDKALTQEPRTKLDIPGEEEIAEAQEAFDDTVVRVKNL